MYRHHHVDLLWCVWVSCGIARGWPLFFLKRSHPSMRNMVSWYETKSGKAEKQIWKKIYRPSRAQLIWNSHLPPEFLQTVPRQCLRIQFNSISIDSSIRYSSSISQRLSWLFLLFLLNVSFHLAINSVFISIFTVHVWCRCPHPSSRVMPR